MPRDDPTWLQLVRSKDGISVHYNVRLQQLVEGLKNPWQQYPSLAVFLGRDRKDVALRKLFSDNQIKAQTTPQVNLRIDNKATLFNTESRDDGQHVPRPVLFADCDPLLPCIETGQSATRVLPVSWAAPDSHCVQDVIISRLLFLFADVVCIFASDLGCLDNTKTLLSSWAQCGSASSLEPRPRLIVVLDSDGKSVTHDVLEESEVANDIQRGCQLSKIFAKPVETVHLPPKYTSLAQHLGLKEMVSKQLDLAREARGHHGILFNAIHLNAFFIKALQHSCSGQLKEFDFVRASREGNELGEDYADHLANFFSLTADVSREQQEAFVASSMLMDAFPPKMHAFLATTVFHTLYSGPCLHALRRVSASLAEAKLRGKRIEKRFVGLHQKHFSLGKVPTVHIHRQALEANHLWLADIRMNTCVSCICRRSRQPFPCHAICDVCVERFGRPVWGEESQYEFQQCIICGVPGDISIKLLPKTATVRGISIDGGGVRAVIALQSLIQGQNMLGSGLPIQCLADVVFGSSSGGLPALDIFHQGNPVSESMADFQHLAGEVFSRKQSSRLGFSLPWWLRCGLMDEKYDSRKMDHVLQQRYATKKIFEATRSLGTKVAVTAVTVAADKPIILGNYKPLGAPKNDDKHGPLLCDPETEEDEPLLWQCARATTAAPGYFTTTDIPGIGKCQDGALVYPNPAELCRSETRRMWPWKPELGVLLSLGTGVGKEAARDIRSHGQPPEAGIRYRFPFRLYRTWMSMDAERAWQGLLSQLDEEARKCSFRVNPLIPDKEPALDSVESIDYMVELARNQEVETLRMALKAFLAASLFFEPSSVQEGVRCCLSGSIRCRINPVALIRVLTKDGDLKVNYVLGTETPGPPLSTDDICDHCGLYCLPIQLWLTKLEEAKAVNLALNVEGCHLRLGPPKSGWWFCEQQGLHLVFGAANHGKSPRVACESCQKRASENCQKGASGKRGRGSPTTLHCPKRVRFAS